MRSGPLIGTGTREGTPRLAYPARWGKQGDRHPIAYAFGWTPFALRPLAKITQAPLAAVYAVAGTVSVG
jgi:hypothetical protein